MLSVKSNFSSQRTLYGYIKVDIVFKFWDFVAWVLPGVIRSNIFDSNFVPVIGFVNRHSPCNTTFDVRIVRSGVQNKRKWKLRTVEVPSDWRPCFRLTSELDRCSGQHCHVGCCCRTYCGFTCPNYANIFLPIAFLVQHWDMDAIIFGIEDLRTNP